MIWKIIIIVHLIISAITAILLKSFADKVMDYLNNKYGIEEIDTFSYNVASFKMYLICLIPLLNILFIDVLIFHNKELFESTIMKASLEYGFYLNVKKGKHKDNEDN